MGMSASEAGRIGGRSTSPAKSAAARLNAKHRRPNRKPRPDDQVKPASIRRRAYRAALRILANREKKRLPMGNENI